MIDVTPYIDSATGLMVSRDGGKDNEILNMATLEHVQGFLTEDQSLAVHTYLKNSEVQDGLFARSPGAQDNSVDNLIAIAYLSPVDAIDMYHYGRNNWWVFNVAKPGKLKLQFFFGRFVGFIPFLSAAAFGYMSTFEALLYAVSTIFTSFSEHGNTSDKCLQVLMNERVLGKHWLSDWGIRVFNKLMMEKYPGGLHELYTVYFGANHPFTINAWRKF